MIICAADNRPNLRFRKRVIYKNCNRIYRILCVETEFSFYSISITKDYLNSIDWALPPKEPLIIYKDDSGYDYREEEQRHQILEYFSKTVYN